MNQESIEIQRPGPDATVDEIIHEWLPGLIEQIKDVVKENAGDTSGTLLGCVVTGEGGGEWSLSIDNGELSISEGLKPDAAITIIMSAVNFVEVVSGQRDDLLVKPPGAKADDEPQSLAKLVAKVRDAAEKARKIKGSFMINAPDPEKSYGLRVAFGGELKDEPDTTITIAVEDLRKMASGELSIKMAMLKRKIKIKGSLPFMLKLKPLIM